MKLKSASVLPLFMAGATLGLGTTDLSGARALEVEKPAENIRSSPDGEQIGTLVKGVEVEELDRQGKWVRIQVDGWIWGPSLRGFEDDGEPAMVSAPQRDDASAGSEREQRTARPALHKHASRVRAIIDDKYGDFYGIGIDPDLRELVVRFRVRNISREALSYRQMRVQRELVEELRDDVDFNRIRIETNRSDGSGQVGIIVAVTSLQDIHPEAAEDLDSWMSKTRISLDGGESWQP